MTAAVETTDLTKYYGPVCGAEGITYVDLASVGKTSGEFIVVGLLPFVEAEVLKEKCEREGLVCSGISGPVKEAIDYGHTVGAGFARTSVTPEVLPDPVGAMSRISSSPFARLMELYA